MSFFLFFFNSLKFIYSVANGRFLCICPIYSCFLFSTLLMIACLRCVSPWSFVLSLLTLLGAGAPWMRSIRKRMDGVCKQTRCGTGIYNCHRCRKRETSRSLPALPNFGVNQYPQNVKRGCRKLCPFRPSPNFFFVLLLPF